MKPLKPFVADDQTVGTTWGDKGSLRMTATEHGDVLHYVVEWVYPNGQTVLLHEYQWPEK